MLDRARALGPLLRERADEAERERRLPKDVASALADAGVFAMLVPPALGGSGLDLASSFEVIEEIAYHDGSAGWCATIASGSAVLLGYMPADGASEVYADSRTCFAGALAPNGRAEPVDGGWRVSGRWAFASGCTHADWIVGGCIHTRDGRPQFVGGVAPELSAFVAPAGDYTIVDTWHVSGLSGTGSHDIELEDVFIPERRRAPIFTAAEDDRPALGRAVRGETLYRIPIFTALGGGLAAVALGIARRAIEDVVTLASTKVPAGNVTRLADKAVAQLAIADAEALVRSARAWLHDAARNVFEIAAAGTRPPDRDRALLRLAAAHAVRSSVEATRLAYTAAGSSSIYTERSVVQRCLRDVHVVSQHLQVNPQVFESAGRVLIGGRADAMQTLML